MFRHLTFDSLRVAPFAALLVVATIPPPCLSHSARADDLGPSPEQRAVAFLAGEVPQWAAKNDCYSCHNNGDAARALMAAVHGGLLDDRKPLTDTLAFLAAPARWDNNGPEGPFKDKKLARIQFAAALVDAHAAGLLTDRSALERAARLVAELQSADGSWTTDAPGTLGSPVTYGRELATSMARRALMAGGTKHAAALAKADRWFDEHEPRNVMAAAATLLALADRTDAAAAGRRAQALELIEQSQSPQGGWGPFVTAPAEVFDTALVLLALAAMPREHGDTAAMIEGGRKYLIGAQEADGGWPPTTRPPGGESYAQRLSTTGWATQALLATRPRRENE